MHGSVRERPSYARTTEGRSLHEGDKIVPPPNWVDFARRCWPQKTAAHLATLGGRDERTAKRWMSGEFEPPNAVMLALIAKLFERGF